MLGVDKGEVKHKAGIAIEGGKIQPPQPECLSARLGLGSTRVYVRGRWAQGQSGMRGARAFDRRLGPGAPCAGRAEGDGVRLIDSILSKCRFRHSQSQMDRGFCAKFWFRAGKQITWHKLKKNSAAYLATHPKPTVTDDISARPDLMQIKIG